MSIRTGIEADRVLGPHVPVTVGSVVGELLDHGPGTAVFVEVLGRVVPQFASTFHPISAAIARALHVDGNGDVCIGRNAVDLDFGRRPL